MLLQRARVASLEKTVVFLLRNQRAARAGLQSWELYALKKVRSATVSAVHQISHKGEEYTV